MSITVAFSPTGAGRRVGGVQPRARSGPYTTWQSLVVCIEDPV